MPDSKEVIPLRISMSTLWGVVVMITAAVIGYLFSHTQIDGHPGMHANRQSISTNQASIEALLENDRILQEKITALRVEQAAYRAHNHAQ